MKSTLKWGSVCLVIYFVFLIVKLPAIVVLPKLQLPPDVKISGVSGTIWHGHAQRITYQGLPLENVNWSLSFLSLLLQDINLQLKAGNIRQTEQIALNGQLQISADNIQASNLQAYIPADIAMMSLPLPIPVQAEGRFKVQLITADYDYSTGCQTLEGQGQWLNAKVAGVGNTIGLGNFNATITCQQQQLLLTVKEPNSLGLDAQVKVAANLQFNVTGRFKPSTELPKEVHQAAQFFGKQDSKGYYSITF
ncbi:type II secretion system protein N [Paraglaciecola aquimarina]|uniref:Type II secretion system protein N n=1 Tax=Paraglaciecola aquimarina TaxID=1235557 RepID=A0ABU3ST93_9ALTE|nr:type II secretion system protein N [Paraglaciecola aquimarina]MDU0353231.1 type II secretion system protein N [Paraglaciecola aquimarina]